MAIGLIVLNGCGGRENRDEIVVYIKQLKSEDKLLRIEAAEILGEFGDERAVFPLIDVLENREEDYTVRESAAIALGQLGGHSGGGTTYCRAER